VEERTRVGAARGQRAAAALVHRVRRVDQRAVLRQQELDAVRVAPLLVGRQREDQVAVGRPPLALVAQQVGDEHRRHRLVVGGAAAQEVAVLLVQHERVARPVGAVGRHHVEVRQQQDRLRRGASRAAAAAVAHDQVALGRLAGRHQQLHVARREAGRAEATRHRLRGARRGAHRVDGVDLDQLLVHRARELLVRGAGGGGRLRGERRGEEEQEGGERAHAGGRKGTHEGCG
jgi:hypothetical protein